MRPADQSPSTAETPGLSVMTRAGTPLVTVVVTVYEDRDLLPGLVDRVRALVEEGALVVVGDDGSEDGSARYLRDSLEGVPGVTLELPQSNTGVASMRTRLLSRVTTSYVWFVDSDDDWGPASLRPLVDAASTTQADVVVGAAQVLDHRRRKGDVVDRFGERSVVSGDQAVAMVLEGELHGYVWNKLFKVDALDGIEFPPLRTQEDFVFVVDSLARASTVALTPEVVYRYRTRPGSVLERCLRAENLEWCVRHVGEHVATSADRHAYFESWFYLVSAAPLLARAPGADARAGVERLAHQVRWRHVRAAARRRRPVLVLQLVLIALAGRVSAPAFLRVIGLVGLVVEGRRRLRRLRTRPVAPLASGIDAV